MTIAIACLLIAALLPYATVAIAKSQPGYDNAAPRDWGAGLSGFRRRAWAAHQNHFEMFPVFAAGVLAAGLRGVDEGLVAQLAVAYVALRVAYVACYVADWHVLRSLVWTASLGCALALLGAAI